MSKQRKELLKLIDSHIPLKTGVSKTERFETGIESLDALLDGGFPRGHIISMATVEGGGKTTMIIQACGNIIEKYDKNVYYFDVEGGATPELITSMGYGEHLYHPEENPDGRFFRLRTTFIQEIAQVLRLIIDDPDTGVIVIDSSTATADERQVNDPLLGLGKNSVGAHARMWSEASRQINSLVRDSTATLVFIHQVREDLSGFIVRTVAARGRALKHITSVEIFGTVGKWLDAEGDEVKSRDEALGATLRLTTTKNRLTKPFAKVQVPLFFGRGVSNRWAYREWLENVDVIDSTTGEATKALFIKGGGYATLTLPSGQYSARGKVEINALIETHIEEILEFIKTSGGLRLDNVPPDEFDDNDYDEVGTSSTLIDTFSK